MSRKIVRRGYDVGDYTTKRGILRYNEMHGLDFIDFISQRGFDSGTIVDMGCGNGVFLQELLERFPHLNVVGVDKNLYEHNLPDFRQHDLRDVSSIPKNFADILVSSAVSQWVRRDKHRVYEEAARILKPSGFGFIFPYSESILAPKTFGRKFQLRPLKKGPLKLDVPQLIIGNISLNELSVYTPKNF
jgi:SAM-dependent methyltransferase